MAEQKESKSVVGKFLGLTQDEKNEKLYRANFQVGDKSWSFRVFKSHTKNDGTPKKGISPTDLKIGSNYTIFYTEYQTEKMSYASKTAGNFFEVKNQQQLNNISNPTEKQPENIILGLTTGKYDKQVEQFSELYLQKAKTEKDLRHATRMLGGFLTNIEPFKTQFAVILAKFEKKIKSLDAEIKV